MFKRVVSFRRLKNGDPVKFKVLAEDLPRPAWLDRLSFGVFWLVVLVASAVTFAGTYTILDTD